MVRGLDTRVWGAKGCSFLQNVLTVSWARPDSYSLGTGVNSRQQSGRSSKLTVHHHVLPWLRMSGALAVRPLLVLPGLETETLPFHLYEIRTK
jgi:hypothetical protein